MITYENGVKRHVKRLRAPTRMQATDVVPNELYLARTSFGAWNLVKVQCVKERGWLRGYVNVRGFYTDGLGCWNAWATVEPLDGSRHLDMLELVKIFSIISSVIKLDGEEAKKKTFLH